MWIIWRSIHKKLQTQFFKVKARTVMNLMNLKNYFTSGKKSSNVLIRKDLRPEIRLSGLESPQPPSFSQHRHQGRPSLLRQNGSFRNSVRTAAASGREKSWLFGDWQLSARDMRSHQHRPLQALQVEGSVEQACQRRSRRLERGNGRCPSSKRQGQEWTGPVTGLTRKSQCHQISSKQQSNPDQRGTKLNAILT